MKKTSLCLLLLFFMVVLSGCFSKVPDIPNNTNTNSKAKVNINESVDNNKVDSVVKKFYPTPSTIEKPRQSTEIDLKSNIIEEFVVTQELQAKLYLIDNYDPGVCYGKPITVTQSMISTMVGNNPGLSSFIRGKYGFNNDQDVYNKIKQINGIKLEEEFGGKYIYTFTDGQCCLLKAYQGEITIIGRTISEEIIRTDTKQNPC